MSTSFETNLEIFNTTLDMSHKFGGIKLKIWDKKLKINNILFFEYKYEEYVRGIRFNNLIIFNPKDFNKEGYESLVLGYSAGNCSWE